jgi:transcriptional regulator GlxA family with amidase domain
VSPEHTIWLVAWPELQPLDLVGPHEVFDGANRVAAELGRPGPRYHLRVVSPHGGEVVGESGLRLGTDPIASLRGAPDTLLLPGGDGVHAASADEDLVAWVRQVGGEAGRLATVCTGTFLAAAAGLLDGRRVATHWARARRLASTYPQIEVDADALAVCDDSGRAPNRGSGVVWSSAGVTAGIDLALSLVEADHDAEVAQVVGRWLVVHVRRGGGQSQFAAPIWTDLAEIEPIRQAQDLIHASPGDNHTVDALASAVAISPRHLSRLFAETLGETPARYVERVRVESARRQLELSDAGLSVVARDCGFGTTETLRRAFHRRLGVSPAQYRQRFRLPSNPPPTPSLSPTQEPVP